MSHKLISAGTRTEFREAMTHFSLQNIRDMFEVGEFTADLSFAPPVFGERRTLAEQYFVGIDLGRPDELQRLLTVFQELLFRLKNRSYDQDQAQMQITKLVDRMKMDGFNYHNGRFTSSKLSDPAITTPHLTALTEASILEQVDKARQKVDSDPAGAITNAYTLVEDLLKALLRKAEVPYKDTEGDIRALYAVAAANLNLSPKGESLESYLKAILQGLTGQISGLYDLANKASDRHARRYNPKCHHAQLAVNVAFTLCEFLLASFEYQRTLKEKTTSG